jgi:DUF1707 SHOCT-like domain
LSNQDSQPTPAPQAAGVPQTRASDADRDAAADLLSAAFAEGRLTAAEHGERLDAAYSARTWQQLRRLTADLPGARGILTKRAGARGILTKRGGAHGTVTKPAAAPVMFTEADRCLLCLLLIVCPPAGIAWWLLSRHGSGTDRGERRQENAYAQDR